MPHGTARLSVVALALLQGNLHGAVTTGSQTDAGNDNARAEAWCSLDDPDAAGLPASLRSLTHVERAILESPSQPRFLLVRRTEGHADPYDAFSVDEEQLARFGEFIPVLDRAEETPDGSIVIFDCEWQQESHASQVSALYTMLEDGSALSVWLITSLPSEFDELASEVTSMLPHFRREIAPPVGESYASILLGHEVHFRLKGTLGSSEGAATFHLQPSATPLERDSAYIDGVTGVNPQFDAGIIRQWADAENDISLSFQVIAHDTGLGPMDTFVNWLSSQYQAHLRGDKELGDTPVELTHVPGVLTEIIGEEELARHYRANKRAPEAGVILQVFLPYSPFAEVRDLRWTGVDEETGEEEHAWIRFVELRSYRRSRSETILRSCNMIFIARAPTRETLDLLEQEMKLSSRPLEQDESFPTAQ